MSLGTLGMCMPRLHQGGEDSLGVALVGLGNYATHQLAPALQLTKNCHLAGIVSGTPTKVKDWQKKYGISPKHCYTYETFEQMSDDDTIDIVYIVLPNFMHAEYTIRALRMGKHVVCEKPMGMNAKECREMIAARDASGKKLQIGYRLYYEPHHLRLHELCRNRTYGKIKLMESSLGFRMANPDSWRMDLKKGGGGAIMDLGVYCIQAARRMTNMLPLRVTAQGINTDPALFKGIYEHVLFQMEFPDGSVSTSSTSFNAYVDRFHGACEKGWLQMQPSFNAGQKVVLTSSTNLSLAPMIGDFQQVAQLDAFTQNIADDTEVSASGEEGLWDMVIIDAIKDAIETGEPVDVVH